MKATDRGERARDWERGGKIESEREGEREEQGSKRGSGGEREKGQEGERTREEGERK